MSIIKSFLKEVGQVIVGSIASLRAIIFSVVIADMGRGVRIGSNFHISNPSKIFIGDKVFIGYNCGIGGKGKIIIGKNVCIGSNVNIISSNHNYADFSRHILDQGHTSKEVIIGDNVWIGSNSVILPGIHVGKFSVVGAGSVVTKNVPPYTVVAGNPAKKIKSTRAG